MSLQLALGVMKTLVAVLVFTLGSVCIVLTQLVGAAISLAIHQSLETTIFASWIAFTKAHFIYLLVSVLTFVSKNPIHVRITSPNLEQKRIVKLGDGSISIAFSPHSVVIGNHQIYTDWAFVWWLSYCAQFSGFFYIILKAELRKIPLLGTGMKFYDFIFLSRKWETDQKVMATHLGRLDANARGVGPVSGAVLKDGKWPQGKKMDKSWPYQVLIFPEGTNMSANTRGKTEAYAAKVGKEPFKHVLLPKTTGLRFTLLQLQGSVEEIYDLTIGYSGVKPEEYGQDIYRLPQVFLYGKNPDTVDIHLRVFRLDEIPIGKLTYDDPEEEAKDKKVFEDWLFGLWKEKDDLMEKYYTTGSFVDEEKDTVTAKVETDLKVKWEELLQLFAVPAIILIFIRLCYIVYSIKFGVATCSAPELASQVSSATSFS